MCFRLWAPAARTVELLLLCENTHPRMMTAQDDGWFEVFVEALPPTVLYRYRVDGHIDVPDPASSFQPFDVHGPSTVVDPHAYPWAHAEWTGQPWPDAVFYELHVGTFSPEGTFDGVRRRLDHLAGLGVTAIELMPVADFAGRRGWGYDGALLFAPDSTYGTPEDLKRLIDSAHARGLMMFLDVVYNHFGPEGNFLHLYAPQFFTDKFNTPWGPAIDFGRREVRDFVIQNALYWLEVYRFDGLRLDAVHAVRDTSKPDILEELADAVRDRLGGRRHVHLVLENDDNSARYLARCGDGRPRYYNAQWNDDFHHAAHVLATGESDGYYADYAEHAVDLIGRCLTEGFGYQGEPSAYRGNARRGEPSAHLPASAFISFIQNHDQVGNRPSGDRIAVRGEPQMLTALIAILLLAPNPPLLFMGQEWGADEPFPFFCDFHDELAAAVRDGRRREFERFPAFRDPAARSRIPDPNAEATFRSAVLDWSRREIPLHADAEGRYRKLLALRKREIAPRLGLSSQAMKPMVRFGSGGLHVGWRLGDGSILALFANLSADPVDGAPASPGSPPLYTTGDAVAVALAERQLPPYGVAWFLTAPA